MNEAVTNTIIIIAIIGAVYGIIVYLRIREPRKRNKVRRGHSSNNEGNSTHDK
jgi:hypothetical protein